jgi:aryl-alcohol dehydrogenase-like predicted oxidoreductase
MRLTGPGIWGAPKDRGEAIRLLKRLPDLGIDFIDTSDAYGPAVNEDYIAEALHPYDNLLIATKGGLTRPGPDIWEPLGRPDYLRQCVRDSLRRLRVQRIDLWQLHRIDPEVPRDDQFGVIADMQKEGLIRHVGLGQVGVEDIEAARRVMTVATVQNRYNLADRTDEAVLEYCAAHGVGFIPWYPLAAGDLAKPGGKLAAVAKAHGAAPSQIALAWILQRSPVMLPIPGTSRIAHLEENVAAAGIRLTDQEFRQLDKASPAH